MLNKAESEANRDAGINLAISNAEAMETFWKDRALAAVYHFPEPENGIFMTEDVREWAYKHGLTRPPHGRAWGAVMKEAQKNGLIAHVGYDSVKNPKAHRTPASVWRKR